MLRIVSGAAALGAFIPIVFSIFWKVFETSGMHPLVSAAGYKLQLMLWPSSIFMIGTAGTSTTSWSYWEVLGLAVLANVVLYVAVAAFAGWGFDKFKPAFYACVAVVACAWVFVLLFL